MSKVVYVIGAGASKEVGLPLGNELKEILKEALYIGFDLHRQTNGDPLIFKALESYCISNESSLEELINIGRDISSRLDFAPSIDNFIDNHKGSSEIEIISKLGIVRTILKSERDSHLYDKNNSGSINYRHLENTYLQKLFDVMKKHCDKTELFERFKDITLVIFNYDRCVEHYLFETIKYFYKVDDDYARSLMSEITIIHPYGCIGPLPWQDGTLGVSFGHLPSYEELLLFSNNIRTFSETTFENTEVVGKLEEKMALCNKMVFLGFHFHPINLKHFDSSRAERIVQKKVYGTALGRYEKDIDGVKQHLLGLFRNTNHEDIHLVDVKCEELFSSFEFCLSI